MSKIFISYRRQDSRPVATLIYEPLAKHFEAKFGAGAVFMDVHGIPLGVNFRTYLNEQVAKADLLLALIADRWLASADERGQRRIDSPNDFVRIEIEAALKRGIPVVPVYVDDAKFLCEAYLPDSLKELALMHGFQLSTDGSKFNASIASLVTKLEPHFVRSAPPKPQPAKPAENPSATQAAGPEIPKRRHKVQSEDKTRSLRLVRTFTGHAEALNCITFSPDGRAALSGSNDYTLKLWDIASGKELHTFAGHKYDVACVAISPNGHAALSGSRDKTLKLWDIGSGREIRNIPCRAGITSVAFSPDGHTALSGGFGGGLSLWDLAFGREIGTFGSLFMWIRSVAFLPDGRSVLLGGGDNLSLWDIASGKEIRQFSGHMASIRSVVISPDGRTALSGSDDKTLKLWDIRWGKEIRTFTGHTKAVDSVTFAPNGRTALSGSLDGTFKVWDIATGKEIRTFTGKFWKPVAFSPDGNFALSGSFENKLNLWDISELNAGR